jgi:hypothetical protein
MRFGRHSAAQAPVETATPPPAAEPRPVVRQARKDGQLIAVIRAVERDDVHVVEADVYPLGSLQLVRPGPYTFEHPHEATAFMTEAVAALIYLGCDVQAPPDGD